MYNNQKEFLKQENYLNWMSVVDKDTIFELCFYYYFWMWKTCYMWTHLITINFLLLFLRIYWIPTNYFSRLKKKLHIDEKKKKEKKIGCISQDL